MLSVPSGFLMRLSLNEIEVTARKAALGAGLPLGLAEEAGAAAYLLAAGRVPVAGILRTALEGPVTARLELRPGDGIWHLTSEANPLPTLVAAPSACDLVIAAARQGSPIRLRAVMDLPILALAQAVLASERANLPVTVEIGGELWLADSKRGIPGDIARLSQLRAAELLFHCLGPAQPVVSAPPVPAAHEGASVDAGDWARIQALADRMLVPATRHSRERGAGAGLIDTD